MQHFCSSARRLFFILTLLLSAESQAQNETQRQGGVQTQALDTFNIPAPSDDMLGNRHSLWATWYYTPHFETVSNGYPLLDMKDQPVGPRFSKSDWCHAALEGSVQTTDANGVRKTYNYEGKKEPLQVDCSEFFGIRVGTIRYRIAFGPYGDGAEETSYILSPYRSIAVDRTFIPYGTVLYIPKARDQKVTLPDGTQAVHDGYFFAADKGGAIKDNHIDVFIGTSNKNPFGWIGSSSSKTFEAYTVIDSDIAARLTQLHERQKN